MARKGWPHHRGLYPQLFLNRDVGFFMSHKNQISESAVRRDLDGCLSLSEKTWKSNHLQMSLRGKHFLLSYLRP